jgi:hypothetical protein
MVRIKVRRGDAATLVQLSLIPENYTKSVSGVPKGPVVDRARRVAASKKALAETKTEAKAEAKAEAKTEAIAEAKTEDTPEAKAEDTAEAPASETTPETPAE